MRGILTKSTIEHAVLLPKLLSGELRVGAEKEIA